MELPFLIISFVVIICYCCCVVALILGSKVLSMTFFLNCVKKYMVAMVNLALAAEVPEIQFSRSLKRWQCYNDGFIELISNQWIPTTLPSMPFKFLAYFVSGALSTEVNLHSSKFTHDQISES